MVMTVSVLATAEEAIRNSQRPGLLVGVQGPDGLTIIGAVETLADAGESQAGAARSA